VPIVLKSGSLSLLEPSGPVKACDGIALPYTAEKKNKEILGFLRGVDTVFTFLGCYLAYIGSRVPTFRDSIFTFECGTDRLSRKV
jgi:hypothetical protein